MKRYIDPGPITVFDIDNNPVYKRAPDPSKNDPGEQAVVTFGEFLRGRLSDPMWCECGRPGPLESMDAVIAVAEAKQELDAQAEIAPKRGYWEVEDLRAVRYEEATKRPKNKYVPSIHFCLVPFFKSVLNPVPIPVAPIELEGKPEKLLATGS